MCFKTRWGSIKETRFVKPIVHIFKKVLSCPHQSLFLQYFLVAFADFFHLPLSGQLSIHCPLFMKELGMALVLTNH